MKRQLPKSVQERDGDLKGNQGAHPSLVWTFERGILPSCSVQCEFHTYHHSAIICTFCMESAPWSTHREVGPTSSSSFTISDDPHAKDALTPGTLQTSCGTTAQPRFLRGSCCRTCHNLDTDRTASLFAIATRDVHPASCCNLCASPTRPTPRTSFSHSCTAHTTRGVSLVFSTFCRNKAANELVG